ncbi:MAG: UDP-N-acetylmuramate dehydrogenase [Gammaproteobacteria bacterium]|nr:UDP-N-acetylmuramate dehydrogenase [Gammaproteobacteria bacterium]MDH5729535.1 UDP-N-acetylmuramate dehydrogenase [Gammaproteobacteria bacterium]
MQNQVDQLRGTLSLDEPMSKHTSWRVGGPADRFYRPADIEDLVSFLVALPEHEPLTWVGLGSNLLVRDGGIRGTVIYTTNLLKQINRLPGNIVRVEAGVTCAKVSKFCARENLVNAEFLTGIPGTMGGALAMNAGAFGGETWPIVQKVETIDRFGARHVRMPKDFEIAYRHVASDREEWFIAAYLQLQVGDGESAFGKMKALLNQRNQTQPTNLPSCGSVFRNPEGDHAARLIEVSGLKGFCQNNACVSEKHANFIVNNGAASAKDIEAVIDHVSIVVKQKQGVELVREVRVVGEPGIKVKLP